MSRQLYGIGETVSSLRADFPDVSVSKIRFLEAEGLVEPLRTPSGYRKFTPAHVERIRYVLTMQRDHYLPLRVIAEHLDALDRGLTPPELVDSTPSAAATPIAEPDLSSRDTGVRLLAEELCRESGLTREELADAITVGVLPGADVYSLNDLETARGLAALVGCGVPVRNTRPMVLAVNREVDLYSTALGKARRGETDEQYQARASSLAAAIIRVHVALLRSGL
jgi:DNA-binding transcriptional MerR regulator